VARFDELVPLLYADGAELCHYFLDEAALAGYLARIAGGSPSCSLDQEAADLR
jgi:hypothetical protein